MYLKVSINYIQVEVVLLFQPCMSDWWRAPCTQILEQQKNVYFFCLLTGLLERGAALFLVITTTEQ